MTRYERVLNGAAYWGAFYRYNPDKFVEDYLHIKLKKFQKILLVMMFWSTTFVLIACRGLGKSFLSAIYCVTRCILFPGTQVCIASGTRGQAINVLEKIKYQLMPKSAELRAEIDDKETKINGTDAKIVFHNTSVIKVVTASDSSRGNRCNVLILDEFRLINRDTINTILRKFLTLKRMPDYRSLTEEEKKKEYAKEKNLMMFLSSAFYKDHWSYLKCVDTFKAMLDDTRRQFICGFPYQLSIEEGLLDPESVADEMSESDFSEIKWMMEMDAMWYGSGEDAFFDFATLSKTRRIRYPMYPNDIAYKINNNASIKIIPKQDKELRILSADIALMPSKRNKNDAAAIFINQMLPTKANRYINNIIYTDVNEGFRTEEEALIIRKLFDEYECDYIVLDTNGLGLGVYDSLSNDITDPETGQIYPALSCCNDKIMAERCTVVGAQKAIWSIKASAKFNSDAAVLLRDGFKNGRIRLLVTEYNADEALSELKGYKSLSPADKTKLQLPYIYTTLLIDELTKLNHDESSGQIRITERSGMRKDRYSSLSYNYYVALQIENKENKKQSLEIQSDESFIVKAPKYKGRAVNSLFGR